jgi:hypothetical protein
VADTLDAEVNMARTAGPVAPLLAAALTGCSSFEIVNDSTRAVEFQLAYASDWEEGEPAIRELEPGESDEVSVNIPLNQTTARLVAWGDWVSLDVSIDKAEGGASYTITDNAGGATVHNVGSTRYDRLYFRSVAAIGDDAWVFGFGDWGPDYGPLEAGATVEIYGLPPADDYAVLFGDSVSLSSYTVQIATLTDVQVN